MTSRMTTTSTSTFGGQILILEAHPTSIRRSTIPEYCHPEDVAGSMREKIDI